MTSTGSFLDYEFDPNGCDLTRPLVYLWTIRFADRTESYVGKARGGAKRPQTQYVRNVKNLLAGRPYRRSKPDDFRRVHRVMAEGVRSGADFSLKIVENCAATELNRRERHWIEVLQPTLNG